MVKATTTTAVIAVAVSTIQGFVVEQITPTNNANIIVKTISIGNANFLKKSVQQPITIEITSNKTESMIKETEFPNTFLKVYDFIAQTQINAVKISCKLKIVYTFLTKPARES